MSSDYSGRAYLTAICCREAPMSRSAVPPRCRTPRAGDRMGILSRRRVAATFASVSAAALALAFLQVAASSPGTSTSGSGQAGADVTGLSAQLSAYGDQRLSPAGTVQPGAYGAAWSHILSMPVHTGAFTEVTTQPYSSDSLHFRDQNASNSGGGAGFSAGRLAALAVDPTHAGVVYAGAADGGVFRSSDDGATWTPIADHLPALAVGSLAVMPDGSLWLGTGEATTA